MQNSAMQFLQIKIIKVSDKALMLKHCLTRSKHPSEANTQPIWQAMNASISMA